MLLLQYRTLSASKAEGRLEPSSSTQHVLCCYPSVLHVSRRVLSPAAVCTNYNMFQELLCTNALGMWNVLIGTPKKGKAGIESWRMACLRECSCSCSCPRCSPGHSSRQRAQRGPQTGNRTPSQGRRQSTGESWCRRRKAVQQTAAMCSRQCIIGILQWTAPACITAWSVSARASPSPPRWHPAGSYERQVYLRYNSTVCKFVSTASSWLT